MIPEFYLDLLKSLCLCKTAEERKFLLKIFCRDKKFVKAVKLICRNTISKQVPLSAEERNKLQKYASAITNIGTSRRSSKQKIVQSGGGFITILLPIVASLLGSIINGSHT